MAIETTERLSPDASTYEHFREQDRARHQRIIRDMLEQVRLNLKLRAADGVRTENRQELAREQVWLKDQLVRTEEI